MMFGLPFCVMVRFIARNVPRKWRRLPGKLPHVSSNFSSMASLIMEWSPTFTGVWNYLTTFDRRIKLVLLWIQDAILWLSENCSLEFLVITWLSMILLVYLLPKSGSPSWNEKRLARELAKLEKEVKELHENLGELDEDDAAFVRAAAVTTPSPPGENKKSK